MTCQGCGAQLRGEERFCPYCGREQEQPNGTQPQQVHYHNHYHAPESQPQVQQPVYVQQPIYIQQPVYVKPRSDKSRLVMLLLWFFLGYLGVHYFYVGRIGKGILYLLTFGLFGLGWFFDFFSIILGTPKDGNGLPVKW